MNTEFVWTTSAHPLFLSNKSNPSLSFWNPLITLSCCSMPLVLPPNMQDHKRSVKANTFKNWPGPIDYTQQESSQLHSNRPGFTYRPSIRNRISHFLPALILIHTRWSLILYNPIVSSFLSTAERAHGPLRWRRDAQSSTETCSCQEPRTGRPGFQKRFILPTNRFTYSVEDIKNLKWLLLQPCWTDTPHKVSNLVHMSVHFLWSRTYFEVLLELIVVFYLQATVMWQIWN